MYSTGKWKVICKDSTIVYMQRASGCLVHGRR